MTQVEATCPHCQVELRYEQVHTGFNNTGFAYCGLDGTLLVWDTFDPKYIAVVGDQHPWTLDRTGQASVERHLAACPYRGTVRLGESTQVPEMC
jgi:hypothetical protein